MKYTTTDDLRAAFLQYFAAEMHTIIDSSSLVPANDPTLLFTNAGMVPFKDVFLGSDKRSYQRATSSQRCVRAGGKHNDLEQVGYTKRHHTFFEMLGNFSFGDYFKREAIGFAWRFLTEELKLPVDKLWVTVYRGDAEAEAIWLNEIGVDPARMSRCGEEDNFWSMGETGPCGPCSEIFFDHGPEIPGGPPGSEDQDGDRYVEIWNLVFMQFNRDIHGELTSLPKPCVDTGMGLERIASVMQGVHDNYEIDLFKYLLASVSELTGCDDFTNKSMRVIADHIRSCCFLIADGVMPSNEGRGYVLRRIIRRAVRHGHRLGVKTIFFYRLVESLVSIMGQAYPLLKTHQDIIENLLQQEESLFSSTLEKGLKIFDQRIQALEGDVIPGETVFMLYDTYGFPPDLTADMARERNLAVDDAGFELAMQRQRQQSQAQNQFKLDEIKQIHIAEDTVFTGYDVMENEATITRIIAHDNRPVESIEIGQSGILVLDQSPFYPESGGQSGDVGRIHCEQGVFNVQDTQRHGKAILHMGVMESGRLAQGNLVSAEVDIQRQAVRCNHSATHLVHQALREVLGTHVTQKGSLVSASHLRFDFSNPQALTESELSAIEVMVNPEIRNNVEVSTQECSLDIAQSAGAMALFGEKYDDEVRVVTMGNFSKEVCGGTHVARTGEIGCFKITSEAACAAGVRRIEAVTGRAAMDYFRLQSKELMSLSMLMKVPTKQLLEKTQLLLEENRSLVKELNQLRQKNAVKQGGALAEQAIQVGSMKLLTAQLHNIDRAELRQMVDQLKDKLGEAAVLLASVRDDKILLAAGVSASCVQYVKAGDLLRYVATQVDGKGGGRDQFAQGGGENIAALPDALSSVQQWVQGKV